MYDTARTPRSRAFTLIELIAVIVVLAILSGIAIPRYIDYSVRAREAAAKGTLGPVRSAIANFYSNSSVTGVPAWPTLEQMQTFGAHGVMQEALPPNPYNNSAEIKAATWAETPPVSGPEGYAYDPTTGKFWLNSNTPGIGEHLW